MKKHLFIILIGLFFQAGSLSAAKIKGTLIKTNGVKKKVTFNIPTNVWGQIQEPNLQYRITYRDSRGKKYVLKPNNKTIKEIRFTHKEELFRLIIKEVEFASLFKIENKKIIFMQLKAEGRVKYYRYYETIDNRQKFNRMPAIPDLQHYQINLLQRENQRVYNTQKAKLAELAGYFGDCPVVKQKIESKTYKGKDNLKLMVEDYNKECPM